MAHPRNKFLSFSLTRLVIGFVACFVAYALVGGVVPGLLQSAGVPLTKWIEALLAFLTAAAVLLTYYGIYRWLEQRPISEIAPHGMGPQLLWGILVGIVIQSLVVLVIYAKGCYHVVDQNPVSILYFPLVAEVLTAVFEEVLFRGIVFRIVEERLGSWIALVISALIFGFLHLMNDGSRFWDGLAVAIEAGLLLGAAYMLTRSLWFPIAIHYAWNFTQGSIFGASVSGNGAADESLLVSQIEGPRWLTGGSFGPEGAVQSVVICVLVAAVLLFICHRRGQIRRGQIRSLTRSGTANPQEAR